MRRQSYSQSLSIGSGAGEPLIVVEESVLGEEEAERRRNESPPRCMDPDSPSLNPYLLSPWRETRKHSLPTPQCTSGITASQVRRLSERGGEGSGPTPREAAFLATLSQAPQPQPGGRRHSVVTISRVPPTLFGRNRRESIAAFPLSGASRILANRRDSTGPPSNSGSSHNLQLDIMDDIAEIKARKVRLKMYKTPSKECVCEIQPLEGGSNNSTQRYQKRRFSEFPIPNVSPRSASSIRRRASEVPRPTSTTSATGIVCSNTDLISILSSLASSATEINRCGEEGTSFSTNNGSSCSSSKEDSKSSWSSKSTEQKRNRLKSFRSNSFDVSILHGTVSKQTIGGAKLSAASIMAPSSWFTKRHQPMWKKQKSDDALPFPGLGFKFDKSKVVRAVKETLSKSPPSKDAETRHKVVWDGSSGTKVDAQVLGSAIEKILTTAQRGSDSESATSSGKSVSPNKPRPSKVTSWFTGGNKDQEQTAESCEPSICSSLKDLFVK